MLATLRLWPLLGLSLTYAATINVIPALDTSGRLNYSSGWTQNFSQSTQDSFKQAEGFGCSLSVTLPINASSVSYVGFKRAGGSMYGYNLDCENDCILQTANGSDPTVTDDASVPQSTLFTMDLDPSTQHTLYVYNIPSDASDGFSQINLHHLNVALASDVTTGAGGDQPIPSDPGNTGLTSASTSSTTTSVNTASTLVLTSSPTTSIAPSSSASGTSSSSNGVSTAPTNVGASTSSATQTDGTGSGSSESGSPTTGSAVRPEISSSSTAESGSGKGAETAGSSSGSGKTGGLSKSVAIGVSVLAVVFGGSVIAALFVFIRQRRKKHRNSYPGSSSGSQPPLSPTGSIIPIMRPPEMRAPSATYNPAIPNPFIDPSDDIPPLDIPFNSSLMQRRMEGRTSPGSPASPAPTIPLPDIPRGATDSRSVTDTRSNSPATTYARSDLWITRSPAKPSFAVL